MDGNNVVNSGEAAGGKPIIFETPATSSSSTADVASSSSVIGGGTTDGIENELQRMLTDPRFLALCGRGAGPGGVGEGGRNEPGIFVSGLGLDGIDDEGVDETDDDMETDDPAKKVLKSAEHGDVLTLRSLLDSDPELVNVKDGDLYSPLHRAAYNDHSDAIHLLIQYKADPMSRTENGWTPLHCAACWGCPAATQALLHYHPNVDVNAKTHGNLTPLHLAAASSESTEKTIATIQLLQSILELDATVINGAGETAAQIARRTSGPVYQAITGTHLQPLDEKVSVSESVGDPDDEPPEWSESSDTIVPQSPFKSPSTSVSQSNLLQ